MPQVRLVVGLCVELVVVWGVLHESVESLVGVPGLSVGLGRTTANAIGFGGQQPAL